MNANDRKSVRCRYLPIFRVAGQNLLHAGHVVCDRRSLVSVNVVPPKVILAASLLKFLLRVVHHSFRLAFDADFDCV